MAGDPMDKDAIKDAYRVRSGPVVHVHNHGPGNVHVDVHGQGQVITEQVRHSHAPVRPTPPPSEPPPVVAPTPKATPIDPTAAFFRINDFKFECPVCLAEDVNMATQGSILKCNHILCTECFSKLTPSGKPRVVRCPMCREAVADS